MFRPFLILSLILALIGGLKAVPESLFLAVKDLSGGALVNRFPVANLWDQSDTNSSVNINPATLLKGENEIRTLLTLQPKDGYAILHLDDEKGTRVYHLKFRTKWHAADEATDEAEHHTAELEWVKPELPMQTFRIEADEKVSVALGEKNEPTFEKSKTDSGPSVAIDLTYLRKTGTDQTPPWKDAPRYETADFIKVREVATEYVEALLSRDIERFAKACDLKWNWEAAARGLKFNDLRATGVTAQQKYKIFGKRLISITRIDTFPDSPIVKISGRQIGVQFDDRALYLQLYLLKTGDGWRVIQ